MSAPAVGRAKGRLFPQEGSTLGPAWEYAWNHVFVPGAQPVSRRSAAEVMASVAGCTVKAATELLRQATRAGLLTETNPDRRHTDVPTLIRATFSDPPPEYDVHVP